MKYWKPKNKNYSHVLENCGFIDYENYHFMVPDNEIKKYKINSLKLNRVETNKIINIVSYKTNKKS